MPWDTGTRGGLHDVSLLPGQDDQLDSSIIIAKQSYEQMLQAEAAVQPASNSGEGYSKMRKGWNVEQRVPSYTNTFHTGKTFCNGFCAFPLRTAAFPTIPCHSGGATDGCGCMCMYVCVHSQGAIDNKEKWQSPVLVALRIRPIVLFCLSWSL